MSRPLSRLLAAVVAGLVLAAVLAFLDERSPERDRPAGLTARTGIAR